NGNTQRHSHTEISPFLSTRGSSMFATRSWRSWRALGIALALLAGVAWFVEAQSPSAVKREALKKQYNAGNYKDAYDGLAKLALDPADDKLDVGSDLELAIACLVSLGRVEEIDDF